MAKRDTYNPDYLGIVEETDPGLFDVEEYLQAMKAGTLKGRKDEEPVPVEDMLKALGSLEKERERIRGQRWYDPEGESKAEREFKYANIPSTFTDTSPRGGYRAPPGDIPTYDEEGASIDDLLEEFSPTEEEKGGPLGKPSKPMEEDLPPEPKAKVSEVSVSKSPITKKSEGKKAGPKAATVSKKTIELSGDVFGEPRKKKTQTTQEDDPMKDLRVPWEAMEDTQGAEEEELPWLLGSLLSGPAIGLGKAAAKGIASKIGSKATDVVAKEAAPAVPKLVEKMVKPTVADETKSVLKYSRDVGNKFREYAKKQGLKSTAKHADDADFEIAAEAPFRKLLSKNRSDVLGVDKTMPGRGGPTVGPFESSVHKLKTSHKLEDVTDRLMRMVRKGEISAEEARKIINRMR